jgi:hypothetical protein
MSLPLKIFISHRSRSLRPDVDGIKFIFDSPFAPRSKESFIKNTV